MRIGTANQSVLFQHTVVTLKFVFDNGSWSDSISRKLGTTLKDVGNIRQRALLPLILAQ